MRSERDSNIWPLMIFSKNFDSAGPFLNYGMGTTCAFTLSIGKVLRKFIGMPSTPTDLYVTLPIAAITSISLSQSNENSKTEIHSD